MAPQKDWHTGTAEEVLETLGASTDGLSEAQAGERLAQHGTNELSERSRKSPLRMLAEQFLETMVLILIAAALVSAFLGKFTESAAILVIVVVFAGLGFCQIGHGLGLRSTARAALSPASNPVMVVLAAAVAGLQLAVLYLPFLREFFGFAALPLPALAATMGAGVLVFLAVRLENRLRSSLSAPSG